MIARQRSILWESCSRIRPSKKRVLQKKRTDVTARRTARRVYKRLGCYIYDIIIIVIVVYGLYLLSEEIRMKYANRSRPVAYLPPLFQRYCVGIIIITSSAVMRLERFIFFFFFPRISIFSPDQIKLFARSFLRANAGDRRQRNESIYRIACRELRSFFLFLFYSVNNSYDQIVITIDGGLPVCNYIVVGPRFRVVKIL